MEGQTEEVKPGDGTQEAGEVVPLRWSGYGSPGDGPYKGTPCNTAFLRQGDKASASPRQLGDTETPKTERYQGY